jgi:hypothetical protein
VEFPEAKFNYFITADAGYCHILPENIILTKSLEFRTLPPSEDKKDLTTLVLGSIGVGAGCFVMTEFFIVGFMLMATLFFIAMLAATKALVELARYSAIKNIPRKNLESVEFIKPGFGYHAVIFRFRNKTGKTSMRKVKLYDSKQNEDGALALLKKEGLL